jgi:hypothetical protein
MFFCIMLSYVGKGFTVSQSSTQGALSEDLTGLPEVDSESMADEVGNFIL